MSNETKEKPSCYILPPINFENLEGSIKERIFTEINHSLGLIKEDLYYTKYQDNAEALERDLEIMKEMDDIDEIIQNEQYAKKCLLKYMENIK